MNIYSSRHHGREQVPAKQPRATVQRYPGTGVRHHAASRVENPISGRDLHRSDDESEQPRSAAWTNGGLRQAAYRVGTRPSEPVAVDTRIPARFCRIQVNTNVGGIQQGLMESVGITKAMWNTPDPKQKQNGALRVRRKHG